MKLWGGIGAGALLLGIIGNALGGSDEPATTPVAAPTVAAAASPAPEASSTPTPKPSRAEQAAKPTKPAGPTPEELAKQTEKSWLENMMVDSPTELLTTLPDSLAGYVNGFEGVAPGTVEITVQLTKQDTTKAELKKLSQSILSLVGYELEDLDRVEVVTADRLARGVSNRREVPMLNQ